MPSNSSVKQTRQLIVNRVVIEIPATTQWMGQHSAIGLVVSLGTS